MPTTDADNRRQQASQQASQDCLLVRSLSSRHTNDLSPPLPSPLTQFLARRYRTLKTAADLHQYFLELRHLDDYDADDGTMLGYRLMYPDGTKKQRAKKTAGVVESHKGLAQLQEEFPWLTDFLSRLVHGRLHRNRPVSTSLECLSKQEAMRVGDNLAQALRQRKTAEAGL